MPDSLHPFLLVEGPPPTLVFTQEVDFRAERELTQALDRLTALPGDPQLDLSAIAYLDSSVLASLVNAAHRLQREGRALLLLSASAWVTHALDLAGLTRFFRRSESPPGSVAPLPAPSLRLPWQRAAFTLPCRIELLTLARDRVMEVVKAMPFTPDEIVEVELAVGEAISNAFRHGRRHQEDRLRVECEALGGQLMVSIGDTGHGFDPDGVPVPDVEQLREGGMGIHFMRLAMDEVNYSFDEYGATVHLVKQAKTG